MENRTYFQALTSAGLTDEQAYVFEPLITGGTMQAGKLASRSGLSRTYTYRILEELAALGLVTREEPPGKPAQFTPVHPFAIAELARKREESAAVAKQTVEEVMGALISDYTASSRVPGVRILSGTEGVAELYEDTLRAGTDICLIRSTYDNKDEVLEELTRKHMSDRAARGIHTRAITPTGPGGTTASAKILKRDKENLTERREMPRKSFDLPAQILIYGNKVAITAYGESLITTIIENPAIHTTLRVLFETIWNIAEKP
ncbi:MAG TPA: helix-turn-helix domain-containing protein [Candidatus Paceibacterota bacterium]|nr:helix-turn-helix domain-containing protein [Candidatus Paceibacterota bacterium]